MKSPTDAFEDAEIAREGDRNDLAEMIPLGFTSSDPYSNVFEVADAILAAGFSRQSPASTTAADLSKVTRVTVVGPDGVSFERYGLYRNGAEMHLQDDGRTLKLFPATKANPYRVAAPEGDGGNE